MLYLCGSTTYLRGYTIPWVIFTWFYDIVCYICMVLYLCDFAIYYAIFMWFYDILGYVYVVLRYIRSYLNGCTIS